MFYDKTNICRVKKSQNIIKNNLKYCIDISRQASFFKKMYILDLEAVQYSSAEC